MSQHEGFRSKIDALAPDRTTDATRKLAIVLVLVAACGPDDRSSPAVDAMPQEDADIVTSDAPDAAPTTCFVPASSTDHTNLSYTFTGGSFLAMGCQPIDPTYWMMGANMSVTIAFVAPQNNPSIRVWGMNSDDTASVRVNQAPYPLDATTASLSPKVVCGESPGPDGMSFSSGLLTGPSVGNYSYQDVTLETSGVTTIELASLTGAGWGFVGASVGGCGTVGPL